ncbi:hypothetical protein AG1IA_09605 [Rhizoctonia solani AG-1 IA]|uniref:Uncharacterized protein n=1 Tax=Thanatephorus cucumeris (strain AG1-IA) TaxID=983506 RepID=L8WEJ5_THACA|nr:hypothetical protein AG1IA_09605 [Rhizoctonia solani AG-1 IA]
MFRFCNEARSDCQIKTKLATYGTPLLGQQPGLEEAVDKHAYARLGEMDWVTRRERSLTWSSSRKEEGNAHMLKFGSTPSMTRKQASEIVPWRAFGSQ